MIDENKFNRAYTKCQQKDITKLEIAERWITVFIIRAGLLLKKFLIVSR